MSASIRSSFWAVSFMKASTTTLNSTLSKARAVWRESGAWLTRLIPLTQISLIGGLWAAAISRPMAAIGNDRRVFFRGSRVQFRFRLRFDSFLLR